MDAYKFGFVLGAAGFAAMALGSILGARGRHGRTSHHRSSGRSPYRASATSSTRGQSFHAGSAAWRLLGALASPRITFSAMLGFGATGLLLRPAMAEPWLAVGAVLGGIAFERLLIAPLWQFFSRFESVPALTLESCVTDEARAVTGFNAAGNGLVAIELDGHIVQLLGVLSPQERGTGVKVRAGDRLRIEAVDSQRNCCTVSYLGA